MSPASPTSPSGRCRRPTSAATPPSRSRQAGRRRRPTTRTCSSQPALFIHANFYRRAKPIPAADLAGLKGAHSGGVRAFAHAGKQGWIVPLGDSPATDTDLPARLGAVEALFSAP